MHFQNNNIAIIIMGVSGVGKTTIAKLLSAQTHIPYFDGDDFHSPENISKMAAGQPLTDDDRKDWLLTLNQLIKVQLQQKGCIIACSALKENYRMLLSSGVEETTTFVFLHGTYNEILERMQMRKNHFIPSSLLQSQFDIIEVPSNALPISITNTPSEIVKIIQNQLL